MVDEYRFYINKNKKQIINWGKVNWPTLLGQWILRVVFYWAPIKDCFTLIGLENLYYFLKHQILKSVSLQVVCLFLPSVLPFLRERFDISLSSDWLLRVIWFLFYNTQIEMRSKDKHD